MTRMYILRNADSILVEYFGSPTMAMERAEKSSTTKWKRINKGKRVAKKIRWESGKSAGLPFWYSPDYLGWTIHTVEYS